MQKFNKNQELAVNTIKGPILVLAGPGSGKTFVLTNRIYNLIVNNKVSPNNILVITFTRAAANEMKERFLKLIRESDYDIVDEPIFGTFHSIFFDILKDNFGFNNDSLLNFNDEIIFLSDVLKGYDKIKITKELLNGILKDIKAYKLSEEKDEKFIPKTLSKKQFFEVYNRYKEVLFNAKKLDFYDMIDLCYELLNKHKDVLEKYREKFEYILIDEFQDINAKQYKIVKLICETKNLFVVGDDDQSIYRFRGSSPKIIREFKRDYKKTKQIILNENYRCAKKIVEFSKNVIDKNRERIKKDLVSRRDTAGQIEIKQFASSNFENEFLIDKIKDYLRMGIKLNEMAIIYRTNLLQNSVCELLNKYNINYNIKDKTNNPYDFFAIKDIISYLKFAVNKEGANELVSIINRPLRYVSREAIPLKNATIKSLKVYYKNNNYILKYIDKFEKDIYNINKLITPLAIRYIRQQVKYDLFLKNHCKKLNLDYEEAIIALNAFEEESIGFNKKDIFLNYIESKNDDYKIQKVKKDSINLMTYHLSKGLEFKVVFLIDVNDNIIPHKKSIKSNDIETERRLFYVGVTRAKDYLNIYFTKTRFGKIFKPSRFLIEGLGGKL